MKRVLPAVVITIGLVLPVSAQDLAAFNAAKDLYASARYDEALTVLNGLNSGMADRKSVEQYRSLCLLALGRPAEAELAIAAVVKADPLYRPDEADAPPRVRAMFAEVRKRVLPEIATAQYSSAKSTYDRQDWAAAEREFRMVLALIDDPDAGKLNDLRVLTVGFLELSARAAAPPEPKPEPPAPAASVAPLMPAVEPPVQGPVPGRIYSVEDEQVVPAAAVRQEIPKVPASVISMAKPRGLLEIVIDEQGRVVGMAVRGSIHPSYDSQLLVAARDWKYKPATYDGQPVKFRKVISVNVKR